MWLWWLACTNPDEAGPRPWQHARPEDEAEAGEDREEKHQRRKAARERWITDMHRAPPDIDWRAVERANAESLILRRNGRVRAGNGEKWVERGSENQAGRMFVGRPSPDGTKLYAGSANGGLWRGNLDGTAWQPLGDALYGGAHHVVTLPPDRGGDPDVLLVASQSGLVHRSVDDGATWVVPDGLPSPMTGVRRLRMSADGEDTIWLVAVVNNEDVQLLRSTDRGVSFELVFDLGYWWGDVWLSRTGPSAVYLLTSDAIYASADADHFDKVGDVGAGGWGGELAGSEAGAPTLYVISRQNSGAADLSRSDDAGQSFVRQGPIEDYFGTMLASIVDSRLFAFGGVNLHVTRDGGAAFRDVNDWSEYYGDPVHKLHADIFGLDVYPDGAGERWYIGSDGGIYDSDDQLARVTNLSMRGLRVSQYYDTHTSAAEPDNLVAGSQDQGYQATEAGSGEGRFDFEQTLSGDYAHLTTADGDHEPIYSVYPGFILVQKSEDDAADLAFINYPDDEAAAWLPPIVADPADDEAFFFPSGHLWRYIHTSRDNWEPERWSDQSFVANDGEFVAAMTFSPVDTNRAYLVTNWGRLFSSDDHAKTWTRSRDIGPYSQYFYGAALWASRTDRDTAWVGGSGYGDVPSVLRTTNGGKDWEVFDQGLPDTLVYDLAEAPDGSGRLFAATETAAFERNSDGEWVDITSEGAPITTYWSVEALPAENSMRFATYGRGIWDYQLDPLGKGCFPPVDHDGDGVKCDTDCDDYDPGRFPGNPEACDGVDADCAEGDESDEDADGTPACNDCDDQDGDRFLGALEVCGDAVDQDCDGEDKKCGVCGCASGGKGGAPAGLVAVLTLFALRRAGRRG